MQVQGVLRKFEACSRVCINDTISFCLANALYLTTLSTLESLPPYSVNPTLYMRICIYACMYIAREYAYIARGRGRGGTSSAARADVTAYGASFIGRLAHCHRRGASLINWIPPRRAVLPLVALGWTKTDGWMDIDIERVTKRIATTRDQAPRMECRCVRPAIGYIHILLCYVVASLYIYVHYPDKCEVNAMIMMRGREYSARDNVDALSLRFACEYALIPGIRNTHDCVYASSGNAGGTRELTIVSHGPLIFIRESRIIKRPAL